MVRRSALRGRIILSAARCADGSFLRSLLSPYFLILSLRGRNKETKASAIASSERFRPLR
ncbi:hypothetical protein FHS14_004592 [Paenibacillus baekrokdamisoli]|uniref:hypothetical protein n=1 Tax=Paenibacillus baekrokdamisoli TaxID=1712516 RepID=UPI000F7AF378|nr:hypothetical protein [Paenibacillus baekrokdamisoli]MBB3071583.1 hypothetical protein [Paenibacillus baekrokdamisoli]